ncbi:hypothetical protein HYFRA_00003206 [Hymenoscyphus fraxineus]|uniref:Short-chain dehydrogenase n=1 Tax=Hymenoscyphus fraxineus TaxID=746836 RepID=A0A9N9PHF6_9HELO|nr:hypothetical protein HYFRA_00003206 [Hymenoscyphus fraxineus]
MTGTIILTGANSSLAIPAVEHLLTNYRDYTLVLTVRNTSESDANTQMLRKTVSKHPQTGTNNVVSIRQLDLSRLDDVHNFATTIISEITDGKLPRLTSIICNAYSWNLVRELETTVDGYEKTFAINHVSHSALVLRLLGSFNEEGRVVLFTSDAHWHGKNSLAKLPPTLPDALDLLVKPEPDPTTDNLAYGMRRYAYSKLCILMWMYALNRYLEKDPKFSKITVVTINPGNLTDSRALTVDTPSSIYYMSKLIVRPFRPLLRFVDPTMRTAAEAGADVIELATNNAHPGKRGFFTLLKPDVSSPESLEVEKQQEVWAKTLEWAKITRENTALEVAFE